METSLQRLEKEGLIVTNRAGGIQAVGVTQRLIQEFCDLNAFLMLKTSVILSDRDGSLASMRNWIFQGASGSGLLFFVNGETTEMISITPARILKLVDSVLRDPFRFFSNKGDVSVHNSTRKPAPPESL